MEQLRKRVQGWGFDPGFLVVLAIALVAVWPFISRASLPVETDAELHIFRLHELSLLIRGGEFYPRWASNFYHGYGYPIFNYYAPLSYYVGLPVVLLPGLDAVDGVKFVFVLGLLLAGVGMYGFVRDNWGRPSAYVATAVYLYAPYVQYIDPHARGVLAESFSFGLFPMALWALDRVRRGGGRWAWLSAVGLTTAVVTSHNLLGPLFFAILVAWLVWQWIFNRTQINADERRFSAVTPSPLHPFTPLPRHLVTLSSLVLGLAGAAFFLLPVILERNAVNLNTLIGQGDNFDFRTHFLSVRELLAVTRLLDWGATEPDFSISLGVAQWVLGLVGLLGWALRRPQQRQHVGFFVAGGLGLVFLMLPVSLPLWETVPGLPYFQFPWRLMGPTAVMLAVVAGVGSVALLPDWRWRWQMVAGLTAVPILLGLPLTQSAPWGDFGEVNSLRMSLIEHQGRWLGTTSTSDFIPATVDVTPERNGNVVAGFYNGTALDRVNRATLTDGATVTSEEIRPLHFRYVMNTPRDTRLRLFLFAFPGWQVTLDGAPAETELGRPEGFMVVKVPQGEHVIDVRFGTTPARTAGWVVTLTALGLALLVAWRWSGKTAVPAIQPFSKAERWVPGVVLGVTAVFGLLLQPLGWLHLNSTGFEALPAQTDLFVNYGDQIALIGLDGAPDQPLSPGDQLPLRLYWKAEDTLPINYQAFVHLLAADGTLVTQSNKLNPGDFPTRRWPLDKYVRDDHVLQLPAALPPGDYTVSIGLWVQNEGWRLPIFDADGRQIGDSQPVFTVVVR